MNAHYVRDYATFNVSQEILQPVTEIDWSIAQLLYQRQFLCDLQEFN